MEKVIEIKIMVTQLKADSPEAGQIKLALNPINGEVKFAQPAFSSEIETRQFNILTDEKLIDIKDKILTSFELPHTSHLVFTGEKTYTFDNFKLTPGDIGMDNGAQLFVVENSVKPLEVVVNKMVDTSHGAQMFGQQMQMPPDPVQANENVKSLFGV